MKKYFVILVFIILMPCFLSAETGRSLKIGVILPLTGPIAEYGVAFQNGLELAKSHSKEISENCSFIIEDSKYDSKTAVGLVHKLSDIEKTPIVYNWGGPTSDAIAALADRKNVALFVWSADPKVSEGKNNVIRFSNSGLDYGGAMARYLESQNYKKIGLVKTDNQYIEAIVSGLQSAATSLQIEIVDNYQPSDQDFKATISKLKSRNYDALGVFLITGQISQFVNKLKAQSISFPLFGADFFESLTEVEQAHGGLNNAVFANNEVSQSFREMYLNRFKNDLQINHAANAYDFANFICKDLADHLAGLSPTQIIETVSSVKSIKAEQGEAFFTRSEKGDKYFKFPVVIRKIESKNIVTVTAK